MQTYPDCDPPDLMPPVSPSAARAHATENVLLAGAGLNLASLMICWRSMVTMGEEIVVDSRIEVTFAGKPGVLFAVEACRIAKLGDGAMIGGPARARSWSLIFAVSEASCLRNSLKSSWGAVHWLVMVESTQANNSDKFSYSRRTMFIACMGRGSTTPLFCSNPKAA